MPNELLACQRGHRARGTVALPEKLDNAQYMSRNEEFIYEGPRIRHKSFEELRGNQMIWVTSMPSMPPPKRGHRCPAAGTARWVASGAA